MKKFDRYISTTLPYANSVPHIGHALEFIQADAISKEWKRRGLSVFFNIGVDEHGLKVYQKAQELGVDTQEYLDGLAKQWIDFSNQFEIDADNFYRTSSPLHKERVLQFWSKLQTRQFYSLYEKSYEGKYCTGCESFKTDTELVDGKCPDHNTVPSSVSENNWFFALTKYKEDVLKWLDCDVLLPKNKINELKNIIENAEDVSVSRLSKNVPWGIPVPGYGSAEEQQVIYVWFEALLNYIFAVPNYDYQYFVQICGPDNIRFQGCLFQAILAAGSNRHTQKLLVHGTVLDKYNKKMSKTIGNVVDPIDQFEKYGLDAVRFYTLAGLSTSQDCSWSEDDLITFHNAELADNFGNLLARTLHLIDLNNTDIDTNLLSRSAVNSVVMTKLTFEEKWDEYDIQAAFGCVSNLLKNANKYINDQKPWSNENKDEVSVVLNNLHYILTEANELYSSALSLTTYLRIKKALTEKKKTIIFKKIEGESVQIFKKVGA